jgi:hypothetical protein
MITVNPQLEAAFERLAYSNRSSSISSRIGIPYSPISEIDGFTRRALSTALDAPP